VEYAGALYHVMSRGDRGAAIVRNDDDRVLFMETLGDACARTGWRIHAYVLMGNHYHLLLETPEANLVKGMAWFLSTYTLRYNARHKQRGHVFQGRYKAVMIEPEEGGFTERVSTYIHLNPLRARMVRWPEEGLGSYLWSSYPAYAGEAEPPGWLELGRVLEGVGRKRGREYGRYIEARCQEWMTTEGRKALAGDWMGLRRGWCLGGGEFRERLLGAIGKTVKGKRRESYGGEEKSAHDEQAARLCLEKALERMGMTADEMRLLKKRDKRKQALGWWLRRQTCVDAGWISATLRMGHRTSVSKAVRQMENTRDTECSLWRQTLEKIPRISD